MTDLPKWLTKEGDLANLGYFLKRVTDVYPKVFYKHGGIESNPGFLLEAIGSDTDNLLSFTRDSKLAAKPTGIGVFTEEAHKQMRLFGAQIGRMFNTAFKENEIDNNPKCPFTGMLDKLKGNKGGKVEWNGNEIYASPEMIRTAYCGYRLSGSTDAVDVVRGFHEENLGFDQNAFYNLLKLARKIADKATGKGLRSKEIEYGLYDLEKVTDKIELPEVANAFMSSYNFLLLKAADEKFTKLLGELRCFYGEVQIPEHGLIVVTTHDLASLYFAWAEEIGISPEDSKRLAEAIAGAATLQEARKILLDTEITKDLKRDLEPSHIRTDEAMQLFNTAIGILRQQREMALRENVAGGPTSPCRS